MLPDPIHPAVVHFPLVLAFLLPISAVVALWAIRRGVAPVRAWAVPLAFAVGLAASAFVSLRTGEAEEERVENVVGEQALHAHEEAAERFLALSGVLVLVAAAGLLGGTPGRAARIVASAASLVVLAAAVQVGAAGGALVYEHGAAEAYVDGSARVGLTTAADRGGDHEREEDEHR